MKRILPLFVLLCAASCLAAQSYDPYKELAGSHAPDAGRLRKLFDIEWERGVRENPEFATDIGRPGYEDLWTDMSEAAIKERREEEWWPMEVLKTIHREALGPDDQLNYDLFRFNLEDSLAGQRFPGEVLAISQLGGVHQTIPQAISQMRNQTVADYSHIIARLRNAPALIDQNIVLMKRGIRLQVVQPRIILRDVPAQMVSVIPDDPLKSALLKPFSDFPATIPQAERDRLTADAVKVYKEQLVPSYRRLHEFVMDEYLPACRDSVAWADLPDGAAWYRLAVHGHTTTDMTPEQIHDLGLGEVKRIRGEMEKVAADAGYAGRYDEFIRFLRTDPQFYYKDPESLLSGYRNIAKQIDPLLSTYFGKLPRLTYGIRAIPDYAAPSAPAAYYMSGSPRAGRPGWFCANTYSLQSRPKWQMPVLTLHESVPGHHLQLSLAEEMENVPEFRKYNGYTAFAEGWALYCEHLGEEMGFYKDRYAKFGELTFEMWRACRLVVDTGLHSQGWSRQQAIDYMMSNAGKDEHEATVEIDRYIASPAQALAYKIGQLRILALRAGAEQALGDKFDIRNFHDALLANGSLPLPILEQRIHAWLQRQKP